MSIGKKITLWVFVAILLLLAAGIALYWMAKSQPAAYRPAVLAPEDRQLAAKAFARKVMDLGNEAQEAAFAPSGPESFDWTFTADEINQYLSSLDEIVAQTPHGEAGSVNDAMAKAGLARPAVSLENGRLTLMIASTEHDAVLSVQIVPEIDGQQMKTRFVGGSVGSLPLPESVFRGRMEQVKESLRKLADGMTRSLESPSSSSAASPIATEEAKGLAAFLDAIDEKPVPTEFTWPMNKARVRLQAIDITPDGITLHMVPADRVTGSPQNRETRIPEDRN
jgi:hypothetical protein